MPAMSLMGLLSRRIMPDYGSFPNPVPACSVYYVTTPEPPPKNAVKRAKPAKADLVWNGTSYAKTSEMHKFCQLQFANAGTHLDYREWKSSQNMTGNPTGKYPAVPYDPMNPLLNKIHGDLANIANMLGEYKQTAKMFSDAGSRFRASLRLARRAYRQGRKGDFTSSYGSLRTAIKALGSGAGGAIKAAFPPNRSGRPSLSNAWLQWHFGVDTLMKDLYSLCEELQDEARGTEPRITKKYSKESKTFINGATFPYRDQPISVSWTEVMSSHIRHLTAYVEIDSSHLKLAADHGLTNPASLLWELTTASFVVDWFIGVGEWLTALAVPSTLSRSICYETQKQRCFQFATVSSQYFANQGWRLESECWVRSVHKVTSRSIRQLAAVRPRWKASVTETRVATTLALLRQFKR